MMSIMLLSSSSMRSGHDGGSVTMTSKLLCRLCACVDADLVAFFRWKRWVEWLRQLVWAGPS